MVGHTRDSKTPDDKDNPFSSTMEVSWLSRVIHLITFSVIFYPTKWVVLNAAVLLPPCKTVVLHVAVGLFSNLRVSSTLQTFDPQVCLSNVTCAFCHQLCSSMKKKKRPGSLPIPDQWKNAHIGPYYDPADRIGTSLVETLHIFMLQLYGSLGSVW